MAELIVVNSAIIENNDIIGYNIKRAGKTVTINKNKFNEQVKNGELDLICKKKALEYLDFVVIRREDIDKVNSKTVLKFELHTKEKLKSIINKSKIIGFEIKQVKPNLYAIVNKDSTVLISDRPMYLTNDNLMYSDEFDEQGLFENTSFTEINLENTELLKASYDLMYMFRSSMELKKITFGKNFNTSNIRSLVGMFEGCIKLKEFDLENIDTSNVADMLNLFRGCESLEELDLSSFKTSKVNNMDGMISCCYNLKHLNMSNFDFYNLLGIAGIFEESDKIEDITIGDLSTLDENLFYDFFEDCVAKTIKVKNITSWVKDRLTEVFNDSDTKIEVI